MSLRKGKRYSYGIHIEDRKTLTHDKPIETMSAPEIVYISLNQHIGAPANPIVEIGENVKKGQMIGEAGGAISANVFASVSGEVIDIKDITVSLGQTYKFIIIKNDFKNDEITFSNLTSFEPNDLVDRIRDAGIVGLGGAGFPTAVKLTPKKPLDTLVINGAECEPYINCDFRLMIERTDEVHKGIMYVARALNIKKVVLGIEKNKPEAINAFSNYPDLDIVVLKKQYPMGSEKHLIYCTTGRKVPTGKMPFDVGCCVQNIKTVLACYEAIELNKPLTEIVLTISGNGIKEAKNLKVAIGTPYTDIVNYCGGAFDNTVKIISGGPMMGKTLIGFNQYVRKPDSALLLLTNQETSLDEPSNCINCGTCARNCPMRLMPMFIESHALADDFKGAIKYGALNCIECGSCAYNCPAKRPLVQSIVQAKSKIRENKINV